MKVAHPPVSFSFCRLQIFYIHTSNFWNFS
jgi:hypothetical protein